MTIKNPAGGLTTRPALYVNKFELSCTFTPLGAVYDTEVCMCVCVWVCGDVALYVANFELSCTFTFLF